MATVPGIINANFFVFQNQRPLQDLSKEICQAHLQPCGVPIKIASAICLSILMKHLKNE
jgi:hypothetical protein